MQIEKLVDKFLSSYWAFIVVILFALFNTLAISVGWYYIIKFIINFV